MNIENFMKENYNQLKKASINISKGHELSEDLLHYSIEALLQKENLQEILDSGGAYFYIIRVMMNSWKSYTSPFYKNFRNKCQNDDILYLIQEEGFQPKRKMFILPSEEVGEDITMTIYNKMMAELNKLNWYDRELFLLYVKENHTISSLSKETHIPRTSVSKTINNVRKHLKNKVKI